MWPFNNNKQKDFVQRISALPEYTPDLAVLQKYPRNLLFACDGMMTPHKGHDLLNTYATKVGRGFTRNKFDFVVHADSGIGIPLTGNRNSSPLRIKGEIHAVQSDHFKRLDFAYGNGIAFHRSRVGLLVTERLSQQFPIGKEEIVKDLPPGSIKTMSKIGMRRYTSESRFVTIVQAWMYIAAKDYWMDKLDGGYEYPKADIHEPKEYTPWLDRYYKYPLKLDRKE